MVEIALNRSSAYKACNNLLGAINFDKTLLYKAQ